MGYNIWFFAPSFRDDVSQKGGQRDGPGLLQRRHGPRPRPLRQRLGPAQLGAPPGARLRLRLRRPGGDLLGLKKGDKKERRWSEKDNNCLEVWEVYDKCEFHLFRKIVKKWPCWFFLTNMGGSLRRVLFKRGTTWKSFDIFTSWFHHLTQVAVAGSHGATGTWTVDFLSWLFDNRNWRLFPDVQMSF